MLPNHWQKRFSAPSAWQQYGLQIGLLALVYFIVARFSISVASLPGNITPVWPSAGIGLAALLIWGDRVFPGIFIGSFCLEMSLDAPSVSQFLLSLSFGVGNTLEPLVGSYLIRRSLKGIDFLKCDRHLFYFVGYGALLPPVISATLGVTSLCLLKGVPWSNYLTIWWTLWTSVVVAVLVFTPVFLIFHQEGTSAFKQKLKARSLETFLLVALGIVVMKTAFGGGYPIEYLLIPLFIWSAFRFGAFASTLLIVFTSLISILGTVNGFGPFIRPDVNESLVLLQTFLGSIALTTLLLLAVMRDNQQSANRLQQSNVELAKTLNHLQQTQSQLVQTEKMSALGQLVAGIAHEINNPVNFLYGNLSHVRDYSQDLLSLLQLYQQHFPQPPAEIAEQEDERDVTFLAEDLPKIVASMQLGADRIRQIVLSLRNFSRQDSQHKLPTNLTEGIDSTLMILQTRLKATSHRPEIKVLKNYGNVPELECYGGQINQVLMNLLANAIDAIEMRFEKYSELENCQSPGQISITLDLNSTSSPQSIIVQIQDNGIGMTQEVKERLFHPFFTTKPVGKGTGLGLYISQQIVADQHGGTLQCLSTPGQGTEFIISLPLEEPSLKGHQKNGSETPSF